MDERDRFLSKVRRSEGCWTWAGAHDIQGYGRFQASGERTRPRELRAHRVAYELLVGPIGPGLTIDHLCRNRGCVNPAHLEPVSIRDNLHRGDTAAARNAAKTRCPQGHEYTDANTHRRANGKRECRLCMRDATRRRRAAL